MEGKELHVFMYGPESADRLEKFELGLKQLEVKYTTIFEDRKNPNFPEENDNLGNHYIISFNNYSTTFGFIESSDLPNYIKVECINLFNSIYNNVQ